MEIVIVLVLILAVIGGAAVLVINRRTDQPGIDPGDAAPLARSSSEPEAAAEVEATAEEAGRADGGEDDTDDIGATAPDADPVIEAEPEEVVKPTFRDRLGKARAVLSGYVGSLLSRSDITDETWDEIEEALIRADVGVQTTGQLLDELRTTVKEQQIVEPAVLLEALKSQLKAALAEGDRSLRLDGGQTNVWLFVGVNGVGKTTSIGKVAKLQAEEGRSVLMAAGDTFRAAAAEQLETWSERAGAEFHRGEEGGDPSSVIFDAIQKAAARDVDVVLADTAGRLHTKSNLMEELRKVRRVADKDPGHVTEVLLVLDATTGQNGLQQARQFTEATDCTGVVLTKLDGSAKGGIALAIALDLGLPIKLVGLGESVDDLIDFDPDDFVEALFSQD